MLLETKSVINASGRDRLNFICDFPPNDIVGLPYAFARECINVETDVLKVLA